MSKGCGQTPDREFEFGKYRVIVFVSEAGRPEFKSARVLFGSNSVEVHVKGDVSDDTIRMRIALLCGFSSENQPKDSNDNKQNHSRNKTRIHSDGVSKVASKAHPIRRERKLVYQGFIVRILDQDFVGEFHLISSKIDVRNGTIDIVCTGSINKKSLEDVIDSKYKAVIEAAGSANKKNGQICKKEVEPDKVPCQKENDLINSNSSSEDDLFPDSEGCKVIKDSPKYYEAHRSRLEGMHFIQYGVLTKFETEDYGLRDKD